MNHSVDTYPYLCFKCGYNENVDSDHWDDHTCSMCELLKDQKENKMLILTEEEIKLNKMNKEINMWRQNFLQSNFCDETTSDFFMSIPSSDFVMNSPEKNLIQSMNNAILVLKDRK